jgi:hypothetical protein
VPDLQHQHQQRHPDFAWAAGGGVAGDLLASTDSELWAERFRRWLAEQPCYLAELRAPGQERDLQAGLRAWFSAALDTGRHYGAKAVAAAAAGDVPEAGGA